MWFATFLCIKQRFHLWQLKFSSTSKYRCSGPRKICKQKGSLSCRRPPGFQKQHTDEIGRAQNHQKHEQKCVICGLKSSSAEKSSAQESDGKSIDQFCLKSLHLISDKCKFDRLRSLISTLLQKDTDSLGYKGPEIQ